MDAFKEVLSVEDWVNSTDYSAEILYINSL